MNRKKKPNALFFNIIKSDFVFLKKNSIALNNPSFTKI